MHKRFTLLFTAIFLSACGGGGTDSPAVSGLQISSLKYSGTAVLRLAGKYMRADMTADTPGCASPSFRSDSSPDVAVLTCQVSVVGALPVTIKAANGEVLYSTTLTVPQPQVTLFTSSGNIVMELNPKAAPVTVNNFLSYVSKSFYASTLFHRVISGFVVQGGGYTTGLVARAGLSAPIALESNKGLKNARASVAMARTSDPNSATSQFFINLVDNPNLDYASDTSPGYAVFGTVVQGMDVVDAMATAVTSTSNGFADVPVTDITISFAFQNQ